MDRLNLEQDPGIFKLKEWYIKRDMSFYHLGERKTKSS